MPVSRGEIVEVNFPLPGGVFKKHPTLVISNNDVYRYEGSFIGVMLSSTPTIDDFSYELESNMFSKTPRTRTQVRCHLIAIIEEKEIISRHGTLNLQAIQGVVAKICADILH